MERKERRYTFEDIIGYDGEKKLLRQIVDIMKNPEIYEALNVHIPSGLMLYGEPGVGKTLMAKCLADESGWPIYLCRKTKDSKEFISTIEAMFEEARKNSPAIIFLDDIDKFSNSDYEHRDATEFIAVQAGIDHCKGNDVFVLATANDIRKLPRSMTRAGRFDQLLEIGSPSVDESAEIIKHYLSGKDYVDDVDVYTLARMLEGQSCAELETIINEAGMLAGNERDLSINMSHITNAYLRKVFKNSNKVQDWEGAATGDLEHVICHEAGHVVISEVLFPGSVTLSSVQSLKGEGRGFTSYHYDEKDMLRKQKGAVVISLAGMAATEQYYGTGDMGNICDLNKAYQTVRPLVGGGCHNGFGFRDGGQYNNSDARDERIESVCDAEIERHFKLAKEILAKNREFFDKTKDCMEEKGTILAEDIGRIKATCTIEIVTL